MFVYFKCLFLQIKNKEDNTVFKVIKGVIHKRVTEITINHQNERTNITKFFVNDLLHREDDKPAFLNITTNIKQHYYAVTTLSSDIFIWYKNGIEHREDDKPAYIKGDYVKKWFINGKLHRENDKPAHINRKSKFWYSNGELHREDDNPAFIEIKHHEFYAIKKWYKNGALHRLNKPAIIYPANYGECFYKNGNLHSYKKYSTNLINMEFDKYLDKYHIKARVAVSQKMREKDFNITKHLKSYADLIGRITLWHNNGNEVTKNEVELKNNLIGF